MQSRPNEHSLTTIQGAQVARWFGFALALVIGVTLFLVTNNAIAGATLPSLVAAWPVLSTGLWLLRSDPQRQRARTCFAFYLAAACWKGAAAALTTVIVLMFVSEFKGQDPTVETISATMLTLSAAVVLNTLVGLGATWAAVRHGIRVWVHPNLRAQLEGNLGAVTRLDLAHYGFNHAIFVVATSLVFPIVTLGAGLLVVLLADATPNHVEMFPAIIAFGVIFGGPILMIPVYAWLSSHIIAGNPQDCWATGSVEPPAPGACESYPTGGGPE